MKRDYRFEDIRTNYVLSAVVDYFSCRIICDNSLYTLSLVQNLHIPRNRTTFVLIIYEKRTTNDNRNTSTKQPQQGGVPDYA